MRSAALIFLVVLAVASSGRIAEADAGDLREPAARDTLRVRVVDALVHALRDPYPPVRRSAVNSLRDLAVPRGLDALRSVLADPDPDVRRAAAVALGLEEPRPNKVFPRTRRHGPVSPDSMARLISGLEDPDPRARQAAAGAMGNIGDPAPIAGLVEAYPDPDEDVRQAIVSALGGIGDPRAVPVLVRAIRDPGRHVRQVAAEALGKMPPGPCRGRAEKQEARAPSSLAEAVVTLLNDRREERREASATAIGHFLEPGDPDRAAPAAASGRASAKDPHHALIAAASDPSTRVRLAAIGALARVGDERALEVLGWRTEDEEGGVRHAARLAIRQIRTRAADARGAWCARRRS